MCDWWGRGNINERALIFALYITVLLEIILK